MSFDISSLLSDWEYEPGKVMVRRFQGNDGKEKIQLRVDLGILQMNAEGRPDGKQPFGHESLFEHFKAKLLAYEKDDQDFVLGDEDCAKLYQEAIQYYHRYICFFELKDYLSVVRDTERNLEVFDFIEDFAESDEAANMLAQMRPQIVMMHTRAKSALIMEEKEDYKGAIALVEEGLQEIKEFYEFQGVSDPVEVSGELQFLQAWLAEIQSRRPLTEMERLRNAMEAAIGREDYEKAAEVRDKLKRLDNKSA